MSGIWKCSKVVNLCMVLELFYISSPIFYLFEYFFKGYQEKVLKPCTGLLLFYLFQQDIFIKKKNLHQDCVTSPDLYVSGMVFQLFLKICCRKG